MNFKGEKKFTVPKMATLDLLLFEGQHNLFSETIEVATWSSYSHVGLVLAHPTYLNPDLTEVYLWESGAQTIPDAEDQTPKFGVRLTNLAWVQSHYDGVIYHRRFLGRAEDYEAALVSLHTATKDRPYDVHITDFIRCWLGWPFQQEHSFFCSAFCGYILSHLGLLPAETKFDLLEPKFFSRGLETIYGPLTRLN